MLILLPPSEGKTAPVRGKRLDLAGLEFPGLEGPRVAVLDALVSLCRENPVQEAAKALGLGVSQADEVSRNAGLAEAATARADLVYTGVLYEALDLPGLDSAAKRRAARQLLITSGLFGLVRPQDRIPAYRLSGSVSLPGIGKVATYWGRHLGTEVEAAAGQGMVLDLRSGAYAPFWRPARSHADRVATVRVLHETDGRRAVVSHFNKATKGRLVRDLLTVGESPRRPSELVALLSDLGHHVEVAESSAGRPTRLDVIVSRL